MRVILRGGSRGRRGGSRGHRGGLTSCWLTLIMLAVWINNAIEHTWKLSLSTYLALTFWLDSVYLLEELTRFFFLLFCLSLDDLFIDLEAIYASNISCTTKSKKHIVVFLIRTERASNASIKLSAFESVYPHELTFLYSKKSDISIIEFPWKNYNCILIYLFDDWISRRCRNTGILQPLHVWVVFIEPHEEYDVLLAVPEHASEDQQSFLITVLRRIQWIVFMRVFETRYNFMSCQTALHILIQLLPLNLVLFVVPPQLL